MVQRCAARYACNNYTRDASVTTMLDQLGWRSLLHLHHLSFNKHNLPTNMLEVLDKLHVDTVVSEQKYNIFTKTMCFFCLFQLMERTITTVINYSHTLL